jgi:predicted  nucleic acid-binding Zn-ribbon protein
MKCRRCGKIFRQDTSRIKRICNECSIEFDIKK